MSERTGILSAAWLGLAAFALVTAAVTAAAQDGDAAPVAPTSYGEVRGTRDATGILAFKGIPYAASTGGDNRFLPPADREPWQGVRDAAEHGPYCPHVAIVAGVENQSEDCLLADVWTPSLAGSRPVMVWLHGGAWHGVSERAEGLQLARRGDVVVVTVGHRLNAFGFLPLGPAFGDAYAQSGHVGLLDLARSLEWVRDNIANFGGDPDNVTILGRSGGGAKVAHAFAMPAFEGLFHRGIVMAGHDLWKDNRPELQRKAAEDVLAELDVAPGDVATLRALPPERILAAFDAVRGRTGPDRAFGRLPWINYDLLAPVVDGTVLPRRPVDAIAQGAGADVPMMLGIARFEHWYRMGAEAEFGWLDEAGLIRTLAPHLGDAAERIVAAYRRSSPWAAPSTLLADIVTDRDWWMPHVRLAEARAGAGAPAYVYFFAASGGANVPFDLVMGQESGASEHAKAMSGQVTDAFTRFARTGAPGHPGLPAWPPYDLDARNVMVLDYDAALRVDPWRERRLAWD